MHWYSMLKQRSCLCQNPFVLVYSKLKGTLGRPMRVRNSSQQHAVHMLSSEKEDDTDLVNSIKPLAPTSHAGTG